MQHRSFGNEDICLHSAVSNKVYWYMYSPPSDFMEYGAGFSICSAQGGCPVTAKLFEEFRWKEPLP